jgi:hypothetical protein
MTPLEKQLMELRIGVEADFKAIGPRLHNPMPVITADVSRRQFIMRSDQELQAARTAEIQIAAERRTTEAAIQAEVRRRRQFLTDEEEAHDLVRYGVYYDDLMPDEKRAYRRFPDRRPTDRELLRCVADALAGLLPNAIIGVIQEFANFVNPVHRQTMLRAVEDEWANAIMWGQWQQPYPPRCLCRCDREECRDVPCQGGRCDRLTRMELFRLNLAGIHSEGNGRAVRAAYQHRCRGAIHGPRDRWPLRTRIPRI